MSLIGRSGSSKRTKVQKSQKLSNGLDPGPSVWNLSSERISLDSQNVIHPFTPQLSSCDAIPLGFNELCTAFCYNYAL